MLIISLGEGKSVPVFGCGYPDAIKIEIKKLKTI
jgi:hypothetical protein